MHVLCVLLLPASRSDALCIHGYKQTYIWVIWRSNSIVLMLAVPVLPQYPAEVQNLFEERPYNIIIIVQA
jgi:hypothetical protein